MYPLIEIKTVPIEIQMKVTNAHLEYARGTAQMEISRDKNGLSIRSQPIRVNIDSFEARNSVTPTTATLIQQQAQAGRQGAYQATAVMAREGRMMMEARIDQDVIPQLAKQQNLGNPTNVNIDFLPTVGPDISWDGGEMSIRYEMDKLNFDWRMEQMSFTFVPGDIEFTVTQQPDVIIKYVGGPLYVPPSADPNYEPIDVNA
ncbi:MULTISPECIES: DUF6470 family protein [Oscillospiraceae]|uniref:DUF6470 family protein n=1 Tax=Oscillospiraceae TaxID=216572 RepID=UPI000B3AF9E3|nr:MULTISPECIES: DUF6470 family protein [Oscillospiraceae]MBM6723099.1 hypothetical protein [Pseudoflavonifractor phocaeensis]OUO42491.1 hypothetical protein B5F88_04560 [Flavonifractor sp. An306]